MKTISWLSFKKSHFSVFIMEKKYLRRWDNGDLEGNITRETGTHINLLARVHLAVLRDEQYVIKGQS